MRSRFEAVYERQKANLENEKEKRKRMMGKDGPFNSNMEALGPRIRTERSSRQSYEESPSRQHRERMDHRQRSRSPISRDRHGSPRRSHDNTRMHAYGGRDERHSFSGGRRDNRF